MQLPKFSMGVGDRFGQQGKAQLAALIMAKEAGVDIAPVWNKSFREHKIIGTNPMDVRREADESVQAHGWNSAYFVDADHINLNSVDQFIEGSDFFTLDVADYIGERASEASLTKFMERHSALAGTLTIPSLNEPLHINGEQIREIAEKYLFAVEEAGRIYRYLVAQKSGSFIVEVSMDETDLPQTPVELLFILSAIAQEKIPAQTIAPKFSGRFNKGVDYVGNVNTFTEEFNQDLAILDYAADAFGLPENIKLSVHSGSDKFAIYGPMREALKKTGAGLHLKTAGTTWLEELIGLAEAGGEGLAIAKEIYNSALKKKEALCEPYAAVIDIDESKLPLPSQVESWDGARFARAMRHELKEPEYNMHLRQLLHVGYKIAADMGERFLSVVKKNETVVAQHVTENLWERHIKRLFI